MGGLLSAGGIPWNLRFIIVEFSDFEISLEQIYLNYPVNIPQLSFFLDSDNRVELPGFILQSDYIPLQRELFFKGYLTSEGNKKEAEFAASFV